MSFKDQYISQDTSCPEVPEGVLTISNQAIQNGSVIIFSTPAGPPSTTCPIGITSESQTIEVFHNGVVDVFGPYVPPTPPPTSLPLTGGGTMAINFTNSPYEFEIGASQNGVYRVRRTIQATDGCCNDKNIWAEAWVRVPDSANSSLVVYDTAATGNSVDNVDITFAAADNLGNPFTTGDCFTWSAQLVDDMGLPVGFPVTFTNKDYDYQLIAADVAALETVGLHFSVGDTLRNLAGGQKNPNANPALAYDVEVTAFGNFGCANVLTPVGKDYVDKVLADARCMVGILAYRQQGRVQAAVQQPFRTQAISGRS